MTRAAPVGLTGSSGRRDPGRLEFIDILCKFLALRRKLRLAVQQAFPFHNPPKDQKI
jgi:hypothetical protein